MASSGGEAKVRDVIRRAAASVGYSRLKPEQEDALSLFVNGRDVFVSLPTVAFQTLYSRVYRCSQCTALLHQLHRSHP